MICVNEVSNELGSLQTELTCMNEIHISMPDAVQDYLTYYGLDIAGAESGIRHIYGTFESGGYILSGHLFVPENYTAVMVCAHGYMNHVAQCKNLIKHYTDCGLAVAAFDMPGHGLSSGKRGDIENFDQYSAALAVFTDMVVNHLNGPYYLVGFSMGSSAVIDYLLTRHNIPFERCVLSAPLVRSTGWNVSRICTNLYKPFIDTVPRMCHPNTSNKVYNDFNAKHDYLHVKKIPLSWVQALHRWNDVVKNYGVATMPVLIVQGTKDSVVEYKYNIGFLKKKFVDNKVVYVEGARHELFNETETMRNEVFQNMDSFLGLD